MARDEAVAEIRQHLAASPARVFTAFADASLVSRWLTPSPDVGLRVIQLDFRVGGAFRFAYDMPGGATMFVNGVYRAIEPPSTIVFSWNIEPPDEHAGVRSEVRVTFTPRGTGTDLLIRHAQLSLPGARDRHEAGWRGALDHLVALLPDVRERASTIGE